MTSDKLREIAKSPTAQMEWKNDTIRWAADEIDRLTNQCNELRKHAMDYRNKYERLMEENAR